MMSMKVGLAHLLRKQRLVACEKTNMGKLEVMAALNMFSAHFTSFFWGQNMLHFSSMRFEL